MKIPSLFYIQKSLKSSGTLGVAGNYSLYGHGDSTWSGVGESDIVFRRSEGENQVFINHPDLGSGSGKNGSIIELNNVTIEEGVSVKGLDSSNKNVPFFLKVAGTLTINGNLNMDSMGASVAESMETITSRTVDNLLVFSAANALNNTELTSTQLKDDESCTGDAWSGFLTYGLSNTFFTMKTGVTGAGGCSLDYTHPVMFGVESTSLISGGGDVSKLQRPSAGSTITGGSGGGFLCIYYNEYVNNQPLSEKYEGYPTNIHANGGNGIDTSGGPIYGGGMMVIAARKLIIGEHGSISCNGGNGNGLMSLPNRDPNISPMMYNNGNPVAYTNQFTGGAGFCTLYKR